MVFAEKVPLNKNIVFYPAVFLGAFLLFLVQPMIGKYLLPWFGGSPSVWTTCLLFFQTLLLAGYAYAHFVQRLTPGRQALLHALLLVGALAAAGFRLVQWGSPVLPAAGMRPSQAASPVWSVFYLLLISIGPAYFLLSTSASLLQAWFHRVAPTRSVYFFYIISNTASLLALVSYPFLLEPFLTLKAQALVWSGGFGLYVLFCMVCALRLKGSDSGAEVKSSAAEHAAPRLGPGAVFRWILLSACGVLMLMASTNQITQDVPPVPFLWILPLALYLLSFIIGFMDRLKRLQPLYILMLGAAGAAAYYLISIGVDNSMRLQIAAHSFILFAICLFCHNELYRSRPPEARLTGFYLCLALGGVLGGVFAAVVAPRVFNQLWEYQIALVLAALLAARAIYRNPRGLLYRIRFFAYPAVSVLALAVTYGPIHDNPNTLYASRNFFGTLRVLQVKDETGTRNVLYHGRIDHGSQYTDTRRSQLPTSYFTANSGIALAFDSLRTFINRPLRVGMLGVGVGTLASYGHSGDLFRLYEINPQIIRLAGQSPFFSYLKQSPATIETVQGDGRIELERELKNPGPQRFDLLILDAFSGDSPPAHLLTREAFELYLRHLAPDGLLAVHISNRYINFSPLMRAVQKEFNLAAVLIYDDGTTGLSAFETEWVILSPSYQNISDELRARDLFEENPEQVRIWTDDYSNLLPLLW